MLYEDTWQQHITAEHPEITDLEEIEKIVQKPNVITETATRTSIAYSRVARTVSLYVNVFAKMDDSYTEGIVTTAFLSDSLPKGKAIWIRKK